MVYLGKWQDHTFTTSLFIVLDNPKLIVVHNMFEGGVFIHRAEKRELKRRLALELIETWWANTLHPPIWAHMTQVLVDKLVNFPEDRKVDIEGQRELLREIFVM